MLYKKSIGKSERFARTSIQKKVITGNIIHPPENGPSSLEDPEHGRKHQNTRLQEREAKMPIRDEDDAGSVFPARKGS